MHMDFLLVTMGGPYNVTTKLILFHCFYSVKSSTLDFCLNWNFLLNVIRMFHQYIFSCSRYTLGGLVMAGIGTNSTNTETKKKNAGTAENSNSQIFLMRHLYQYITSRCMHNGQIYYSKSVTLISVTRGCI